MNILKEQEKNIRGFIRLVQFLFLIFSIFFVAARFGLDEEVSFLQNDLIAGSLPYLGISSVILYGIFFAVLLNQRSKIGSIESTISDIEFRR